MMWRDTGKRLPVAAVDDYGKDGDNDKTIKLEYEHFPAQKLYAKTILLAVNEIWDFH